MATQINIFRSSEQRRPRAFTLLFAGVLFTSILPYTRYLPRFVSYALVLAAYAVIFVYIVRISPRLVLPRSILAPLIILSGIFIYHTVISPTIDSAVRTPVFIFVVFFNLFVIPRFVNLRTYTLTVACLSSVLVFIGLPTVVFGEVSLFGFSIKPWTNSFRVFGIELFMLNSVMYNSNPFSQFVGIGLISSVWLVAQRASLPRMSLLGLTAVGLFLSQSRGAILAVGIGLSLYISSMILGMKWLKLSTTGVLIGAVCGMVVLLMFPSLFDISLTGRRYLWLAAIEAGGMSPLLGTGPGQTAEMLRPYLPVEYKGAVVHNSYLRMLVTTGILGTASYLFIHLDVLRQLLIRGTTNEEAAIVCIIITGMVMQMFESFSLFGISSTSIIVSISVGLGLNQVLGNDLIV